MILWKIFIPKDSIRYTSCELWSSFSKEAKIENISKLYFCNQESMVYQVLGAIFFGNFWISTNREPNCMDAWHLVDYMENGRKFFFEWKNSKSKTADRFSFYLYYYTEDDFSKFPMFM